VLVRKAFTAIAATTAMAIAVLIPSTAHADTNVFSQVTDLRIHSSHQGWCLTFTTKVAPAAEQPRSWKVLADFCQPFRFTRTVDVLTHGATYTHTYWDWEQQPELYSYVGRALADGRATLAYDRIGNGESTRPDSSNEITSNEITMTSDAFVLHQLIETLQRVGYRHINSIGHSYGSGVVLAEAAKFDDVDRVVITGYLHRPSNPLVTAGNYPANQDPKFADDGLDGGWLTTRPGARAYGFHAPDSDPALIAFDEEQKDLVSLTGLLDFLAQRNVLAADNLSRLVAVPVLSVTGQRDAIFCYDPAVFDCANEAVVTANEAPFFHNATVRTIPGSGHDLALHPSAGVSYEVIADWLTT
jgi:pimeloyl-ACP methyl ester carboxylesterase